MLSAGVSISTMPGFEKFGLPNLCKKQLVSMCADAKHMSDLVAVNHVVSGLDSRFVGAGE